MRKQLLRWEAAGFLFVAAAGTLLHFVYDWSGGSPLAAATALAWQEENSALMAKWTTASQALSASVKCVR